MTTKTRAQIEEDMHYCRDGWYMTYADNCIQVRRHLTYKVRDAIKGSIQRIASRFASAASTETLVSTHLEIR